MAAVDLGRPIWWQARAHAHSLGSRIGTAGCAPCGWGPKASLGFKVGYVPRHLIKHHCRGKAEFGGAHRRDVQPTRLPR